MPPRHLEESSNNNIGGNASPSGKCSSNRAPGSSSHASQRPLVTLRSLTQRNSVASFDPVRIYNEDHEADGRVSEDGSDICAWLRGRSVLVSGATGFLGKVLVEKLLRACQGLGHVFVLIRAKKGKTAEERLHQIYDDVVSIIFHVAATVNFDEKLKMAVDINVRGSAEMLQLGKECGARLAAYVHVSSTYANCTRMAVDERVYEPPLAPSELVTLAEQVDNATLEQAKFKILGEYPNTYSFTKCVAEKIIAEQSKGMPICIFRPAIVISTYREPLRGWTDNMYGPTGVFMGVGMGVIRTFNCDPDKLADMVPVDMVVNCMIAAAHDNWIRKSAGAAQMRVYNYVSSTQKPIRWSEICAFIQYYGFETPTMQAMWYFCFRLNKHRLINWLYLVFLHWFPALLADGACLCLRREPKLTKLYKKIHKFLHVISYFSVKEWQFSNENVQLLWEGLREVDRAAFPFSMEHLDWDEHSQTHALGLRSYLLKEDLVTLPQARKRWKRLYYLHRIVQFLTGMLMLTATYSIISCFTNLF